MTVDRSYLGQSTSNEHKMIDIQHEIQKLQADLEFHEQKIRLIKNQLEQKNSKNVCHHEESCIPSSYQRQICRRWK